MNSTAARRWLHAATLLLLPLPDFVGWSGLRLLLGSALAVAVTLETLRLRSSSFRSALERRVPVFRPHEASKPSGAFWLCVALNLAAWLPEPASFIAMGCASLADPSAAWIGSWSGSTGRKTWLGSAAAFVAAVLVARAFSADMWSAVMIGAAASAAERWAAPLDDNVLVGPVAGVVALLLL